MNFPASSLIIVLLLVSASLFGAGCKTFFSEATPPAIIKIAGDVRLNQNWREIALPAPLEARAKIHLIALKLPGAKGWADENKRKIRLADEGEATIEVELIDEKGIATPLFPNGFGNGFVEFGKRAENKEKPEESYFQAGQKFSRIRLRTDRTVTAEEIVWTEFEF
jgi:hypothetical protein